MLLVVFKLVDSSNDKVTPVYERHAISFPPEKVASPGIRMAVHADLDTFMNAAANRACLIEEEDVKKKVLVANELIGLAKLVESGDRVLEANLFHETDGELFIIKLKRSTD